MNNRTEIEGRLLRLYAYLLGFGGFTLPSWEVFRGSAFNLLERGHRLSYLANKFEAEIIAEISEGNMALYVRANYALGEGVAKTVENRLSDLLALGTTNRLPEPLILLTAYCEGAQRDFLEPEVYSALRLMTETMPTEFTFQNGTVLGLGMRARVVVSITRGRYLVECTQSDRALQLNVLLNLQVAA